MNHPLFLYMGKGLKLDLELNIDDQARQSEVVFEKKISHFLSRFSISEIKDSCYDAQVKTRQYIENLIPEEGFYNKKGEGINLREDNYHNNPNTNKQIIKGKLKPSNNNLAINAKIYANYYARWWTGGYTPHFGSVKVYGRGYGFFELNRGNIEREFTKALQESLNEKFNKDRK